MKAKEDKEVKEIMDRDHRVLGQRLDLFSINEEAGVGLVLWHPKGALVRKIVEDFWVEEHLKRGYQLVCTPHMARAGLWETSGHMQYYSENMYTLDKEGETYVVKPMNCPFHILIYKSRKRSYRDLPIRYAEWGTVYRYERSGTLHGLLRVRGLTQDDAHIFCTPEQIEDEVSKALEFTEHILKTFGFHEYKIELSTKDPDHPERYMGSNQEWEMAQETLARALKKRSLSYAEMPGEAAFYGPKIDIKLVDALERVWQCTTIQFDFNLPKRFHVTYMGPNGMEHPVVMVHRVLLGAIERFFGVLIEHYGGNFPVWLAPTQVKVLPISDKLNPYAKAVHEGLLSQGVRSELDDRSITVSSKIRDAEMEKTPYIIICGRREEKSRLVSVRRHGVGPIGVLTMEKFSKKILKEIKQKS